MAVFMKINTKSTQIKPQKNESPFMKLNAIASEAIQRCITMKTAVNRAYNIHMQDTFFIISTKSLKDYFYAVRNPLRIKYWQNKRR